VALYELSIAVLFHMIVTLVEEPHLPKRDAHPFARYAAEVPRLIGFKPKRDRFSAKG
jgi:hypothetical protein